MELIKRKNIERILLFVLFTTLSIVNIDPYVTTLSYFYILLMIISFFIKPLKNQNLTTSSPSMILFFIMYFIVLTIFIPDFVNQKQLFFYSLIFIFIINCYFLIKADHSNESSYGYRDFNHINIMAALTTYFLLGANIWLMTWIVGLIAMNVLYKKYNKIYTSIFITLLISLVISTNQRFNDISSLYLPDFDTGDTAIGSYRSTVVLRNKIIFKGQGDLPDTPLFYKSKEAVLSDFNNNKISWDQISYLRNDPSLVNVVYNIKSIKYANTISKVFFKDNYINQYADYDNFVAIQLDRSFLKFKDYYKSINKKPVLKNTNFIDLFDIFKDYKPLEKMNFKSQFLKRGAIPVKKEITVETPLQYMDYLPQNVLSIASVSGNKTVYQVYADNIAVIGQKHKYQKLNITYLDSMYISYRTPNQYDYYLSDKYKDIIKIIAPEIGINDTDDVYTKEKKIHNWFARNFKYTLKLKYNGYPRTIEDFLLRDRRGHCEYFATATALISRYYGIPTDYASGIVIDEKGDKFSGNKKKGHAWNLFWDGAGWIQMDNTVSTFDNDTPQWLSQITTNINLNTLTDLFKNINFNLKMSLSFINKSFVIFFISSVVLIMIISYLILKIYKKKNYNKFLEKKLRKDLKVYLKKHPKEDFMPWKTWANSTGEKYCINRVEQYYNEIYPLK